MAARTLLKIKRGEKKKAPQEEQVCTPPLILGARQCSESQHHHQRCCAPQNSSSLAPKLLDECLRFSSQQSAAALSERPVWNVVGVLGKRRVGKTTLARNIAAATSETLLLPSPSLPRTSGIDLLQSPEHAIVLDAQAILDGRLPPDAPPSAPDTVAELRSLQIAVLLLSVCHRIVVVQDRLHDESMAAFLKAALMLKYRIPDVSTIGTISYPSCNVFEPQPIADEHTASLVFAFNNLCEDLPMTVEDEDGVLQSLATEFPSEPPCAFFLPSLHAEAASVHSLGNRLEALTHTVLAPPQRKFKRAISMRDWALNAGLVWDLIQRSSFVAAFSKQQKGASFC